MTSLLLLTTMGLLAADLHAKPLSGPAVQGRLVQLAPQIVLDTPEGQKPFRPADLLYVTNPQAEPADDFQPKAWIKLVDGTLIVASGYTATGPSAAVPLAGGASLEIPTRQIDWVRFREPSPALAEQWDEATGKEVRGDRIVVRRSPQAVNYLEGLLADVTNEAAKFKYDGNDIPAPRERLEGLVYFHALKPNFAAPICKVGDAHGSTWNAKSLELEGETVHVVCLSNVKVSLPLALIRKFDYSTGSLVFLSDLEPQTVEWTPWFGSTVLSERLEGLYAPKRDRSFSSGPLLLRTKNEQIAFDKGLALHSRTRMVYRLPGDHRRFRAQAGIDARMGNAGDVELVVSGDGRELFRHEISGGDEPVPLDLDIEGVRRLEILVDYGKNMDLADHLNLCHAMLTQ